ncbi:hypothetical protein RCH18_000329 [Flavobacterium sp. PL11]|jgi:hypothetical protein|uniref:hypothetical protein n=1 Tax=Flavobacterium sp. PL11 TaxID=3071717 RepID=UPI002DFB0169|nr:hypothetical protein [Flavobacterium sp. PL11]
MKKLFFQLAFLTVMSTTYAQVGIGIETPSSSAMLEVSSTTKGMLFPRMTTTQRTAIGTPVDGLQVYDTELKSLYFYDGTSWINYSTQYKYGDIKSGMQTADHDGWVALNGRAKTTLTASQQARANALFSGSALPDANNAYLSQTGGTLGAVTGSNTTTLAVANLPAATFSGTAQSAGNHQHSIDPAAMYSYSEGSHYHTGRTDNAGQHSHPTNAGGGNNAKGLAYVDGQWTIGGSGDRTYGEVAWSDGLQALVIDGSGNHSHNFTTDPAGSHYHVVDPAAVDTSTMGAHPHDVSVNSGGSGAALNIAPKSLVVNMFIYLGN